MAIIRYYDDFREFSISLTANERSKFWNECMIKCEGHMSRAKFDQIIREVYGETPAPDRKMTQSLHHQVSWIF